MTHPHDTAHRTWAIDRLAELRRHHGITKTDYARRAGTSIQAIIGYERGNNPGLATYLHRATIIGHPVTMEFTTAAGDGEAADWPTLATQLLAAVHYAGGYPTIGQRHNPPITGPAVQSTITSAGIRISTLQALIRAMGGVLQLSHHDDPYPPWSWRTPEVPTGRGRQRIREVLGITRAELARRLGVAAETLADWEGGHYQPLPVVDGRWVGCLAVGGGG
jgi:transcriptional regulator with XRE-family HTH domain